MLDNKNYMLDTAIVTDQKFFHDYIDSTFCNADDPSLKDYNIMVQINRPYKKRGGLAIYIR